MKIYFLEGYEEWCSIARMIGWDANNVQPFLEDSETSVVFIPEYIPVSHVRLLLKKSHIVVVWRDYRLGVIENMDHTFNVVTDEALVEKVNNAVYIPENVHDIFSILRVVSENIPRTAEVNDSELENKSVVERAHILKNTRTYKGKKFIREAYVSGCDVPSSPVFVVPSKETVARHLNDFLNKLKIFISIN